MMTREEAALIPRRGPRSPRLAARTPDDGRRRDAREIEMLEGELNALARDIRSARSLAAALHRGTLANGRTSAPLPAPRGERVPLAGGGEIAIRPIEPGDAPALRAAFGKLSALSRYKRFLGALDHLNGRQLQYLTRVDHADHEALVALDAVSGTGVGIARYMRDAHDPGLAHVAVVVTDGWQRRGVGSALLERLAQSARAAGIERLTGSSIVGDRAAVALATRAGSVTVCRGRPGTTELTLRLVDPPARAAGAAGCGGTRTVTRPRSAVAA
jgi:GNAT superfamily N-acetyltransferase